MCSLKQGKLGRSGVAIGAKQRPAATLEHMSAILANMRTMPNALPVVAVRRSALTLQGEVLLAGSVSYTSQNAWILNCSLRDNVVLAGTYSEAAYQRVLQCCALLPDMKTLPAGASLGYFCILKRHCVTYRAQVCGFAANVRY